MTKPMAKSKKAAPSTKSSGALQPLHDLVYQALETEMGGVDIYITALSCVQNADLRAEWTKYLEQTKRHVEVVRELCGRLTLDPDRDTPGRQVVRHIGKSLVTAMQMAKGAGDPGAAEIVAAECITLAETKDHANWALIQTLSEVGSGKQQKALDDAQAEVEDEEDQHLYHSIGWARELWLQSLGLDARLPPPEEEEDVQSMEEAAQAKKKGNAKRG
jgi:hypothetical protein